MRFIFGLVLCTLTCKLSTVPFQNDFGVKSHVFLTALKFCGATLFIKFYQEPMGSWLYMVV